MKPQHTEAVIVKKMLRKRNRAEAFAQHTGFVSNKAPGRTKAYWAFLLAEAQLIIPEAVLTVKRQGEARVIAYDEAQLTTAGVLHSQAVVSCASA